MLVDPRAGSGQFLKPLQRLDVPAESCRLDAGDVMFAGQGPSAPVVVGVEIKRLQEVPETIRTGRFASQQLHALLDACQSPWLLVYGRGRRDSDGMLSIRDEGRGGRWFPAMPATRADTVESWLVSMAATTAVRVVRAESFDAAAHWLAGFWRWWQRPWSSHTAAKQLYRSAPRASNMLAELWSTRQDPQTLPRRLAKELPGVGWERSAAVAAHFGDAASLIRAMAAPDPAEWAKVPGIGKGIAADIADALRRGAG